MTSFPQTFPTVAKDGGRQLAAGTERRHGSAAGNDFAKATNRTGLSLGDLIPSDVFDGCEGRGPTASSGNRAKARVGGRQRF